ncbi:MAG: BACON domain-containing protein [Prevotella sp.]|nr:BACON domain-containing protein [Prevotella sp.]
MKKLLCYAVVLLTGLSVVSCSGGNDGGTSTGGTVNNDYIRIDNNVNSVTLSATEKQKQILVYSNCSWTIEISNSNWTSLSIDHNSGSGNMNLWLSSDENTNTTSRTATLTFRSPGISKTLTVIQEAGEAYLRVSPESHDFIGDGGEYTFTIESSSAWRLSRKPDWCTLDKEEGPSGSSKLTVTVGENPSTSKQEGQIVVDGEKDFTINVSQLGKNYSLTLGTDGVAVDAVGGEDNAKTFSVTCNGTWTTSISHDDGGSWCSITPTNGAAMGSEGTNVKVTCQPNYTLSPRYATVKVVAGDNAKEGTVRVTQQAATYPVFAGVPTCREVSSTMQEVSVSFTSMYEVTEYGFCLGTEANPTTRYKVEGGRGKSGTITMQLTVEEGKTYHVRAYAVSPVGDKINYSEETTFETKGNQPGKGDIVNPSI